MRRLTTKIRSLLNGAQRRFERARSGSVLILVVALLVLVALAGTAMMATARTDRFTSAQHTANTQIELLVDGVVRLAKAAMIDDLFGTDGAPAQVAYRPPVDEAPLQPYQPAGQYEHADSVAYDPFIASRTPIMHNGRPTWFGVTLPLVSGAAFEDPRGNVVPTKYLLSPGSVTLNYGGTSRTFPALQANHVGGARFFPWSPAGTQSIDGSVFIAADTDGDGIADAGLWKMPVGQLNGITYYAAVRVIDNGSAFNASVAMERDNFGTTATTLSGNFFPPNVDWKTLFYGATTDRDGQLNRLNAYRYGFPNAAGQPGDPSGGPLVASITPVTDPIGEDVINAPNNPQPRNDFKFLSPADQFYHQLARSLDHPGFYTGSQRFRSLTDADATALAYHFLLRNPSANPPAPIEQMLLSTLHFPLDASVPGVESPTNPKTRTRPYVPTDFVLWYNENFNYTADVDWNQPNTAAYSRRPLTVVRNGVSNLTMSHDLVAAMADANIYGADVQQTGPPRSPGADPRELKMYAPPNTPLARASLNTATGGELWRGFYETMMPKNLSTFANGSASLAYAPAAGTSWEMFRSAGRDPAGGVKIDARNMALLRSAIAATNAIDYRDSDENVSRKTFRINVLQGNASVPATAVVYGAEAQPYITEVYVNNDNAPPHSPAGSADPYTPVELMAKNPMGYVAIELYNPTNQRIKLDNWSLGIVNRSSAAYAAGNMTIAPLLATRAIVFSPADGISIAPNDYLVLENLPGTPAALDVLTDAQYRPKAAKMAGARTIYVPGLHRAISTGAEPGKELVLLRPYISGIATVLSEMVPVDSFDFAARGNQAGGIALASATTFNGWHYVRQNGADNRWKCTYPGKYYTATYGNGAYRQEGVEGAANDQWSDQTPDPWYDGAAGGAKPILLGGADPNGTFASPFGPIQLANTHHAGPNKLVVPPGGEPTNRFPFGGFARNGDLLEVPFIGAYKIYLTDANTFAELNPITQDLLTGDDADPADDAFEQVGRFCPLKYTDFNYGGTDYYGWAIDLFDHFSVQNPNDDYLPNIGAHSDPDTPGYSRYGAYVAGGNYVNLPQPYAVKNGTANPNENHEETAPIQGLININTANWRVLASLPFTNDATKNMQIAQNIVTYRDGDQSAGRQPVQFQSIFELNRVTDFQTGRGTYPISATANPGINEGDMSPDLQSGDGRVAADAGAGAPDDKGLGDFESRFLVLNRISNLITTRADTYTVYVMVQGWRRAGTPTPELVVQRRISFIADRTGATPANRDVSSILVPSD